MLRNFADWLRLARPELTSDVVTLRWAATENFKHALDNRALLDVVRLCYKLAPRDEGVRHRLEAAVQESDAAFPMRGNEYELQVIAACVAMLVLEDASDAADVTALAIISANVSDFRNPAVLPDLVPRAEKYLVQRGSAVRVVTTAVQPQPPNPVTKAVNAYVNDPIADRDVELPLTAIAAAIQALADDAGAIRNANGRAVDMLFERSEMMWYAMGSHDLVTGQSLKSFGNSAPLVVAADMAEITRFGVPPLAVRAIMLRVLTEAQSRKGKNTSITDAVAGLNTHSRARFTDSMQLHASADLWPIHAAIVSASNGGWDFSDVLGFDGKATWSPAQLAYQAYIERLLIAAAGLK